MAHVNLDKDLIPLSDFRASYKKYIMSLSDERNSIVLTQNGKAAAVLVSPGEYDQLTGKNEVLNLIASRLQEISNGEFVTNEDEMWKELEA
ncbi:type II toxin-antitoxin system Phd/YefM family antitoxin [Oceanispirochaeta sp.]|jgi:prevent-host-death family protein|uniref:type II toxin-antitoxin system Phd/YefM family antitoxin n=1 Tax=Oceanispirochaeta sp. TaxID=2035350 RepID=UPI0026325AE6|nr:type II toxin-antitoxin system Phd/YefM family antitoxin [Oceanispirochaeta sp.]MDA3955504.1 type II toxin-antitoxin system Phd/YefM family antitoxin [Oceanispirochaeta sp.]